MYDIILIGAGPASMNAALYAARADLKVAMIEMSAPGGKLLTTNKIENWIGDQIVGGFELATRFFEHATKAGAEFIAAEVVNIRSNSEFDKEVLLADGQVLKTKSIIIGTGMKNRVPSFIKNLLNYEHKGFSYCGICDGPMFKNQPTVVLGGGNSAVEEGTYLASIATRVYVVTNSDKLTAEAKLIDELLAKPNVEVLYNTNVLELKGDNKIESVVMQNEQKGIFEVQAASLFSYIGFIPTTDYLQEMMILDEKGFIITDENMETKIPNIFAIGDIRVKDIRQIITATSDGAIAAKVLTNRLG